MQRAEVTFRIDPLAVAQNHVSGSSLWENCIEIFKNRVMDLVRPLLQAGCYALLKGIFLACILLFILIHQPEGKGCPIAGFQSTLLKGSVNP